MEILKFLLMFIMAVILSPLVAIGAIAKLILIGLRAGWNGMEEAFNELGESRPTGRVVSFIASERTDSTKEGLKNNE